VPLQIKLLELFEKRPYTNQGKRLEKGPTLKKGLTQIKTKDFTVYTVSLLCLWRLLLQPALLPCAWPWQQQAKGLF
jgi:hypothetical protein